MSAFLEWQSSRDECHTVVPIPGGNFYDTGIQKFLPIYDKCLISGSEYVEK